MSSFITNSKDKKLKQRISDLIQNSAELKFLVGFFYFSGIVELYEAIKKNPSNEMKVLVGLNVDLGVHGILEYADDQTRISEKERFERFLESVSKSINSDEFDCQEFYEQILFFIDLIKQDKLKIRKTFDPNHAKLYIFKMKPALHSLKKSIFITGSSNLTKAGISSQNEFNVEISDFGTEEAEKYFDDLWEDSDKITERQEFKDRLLNLIETKTHIAEVTPFEAYALILKNYLDSQSNKKIQDIGSFLKKKGYVNYKYQTDAVAQALSIIESYNGVIISDVVGLGKSIIASLIAKLLNKRGVIICPPNLIGADDKKSGWQKYKEDFELHNWEIRSLGIENLEKTLDLVRDMAEFEVIIVDEAHRFRNQDTRAYDTLKNICRGKIVVLLTATPFNNSPADIFSLLDLFIVAGKSKITLDDDLDFKFREYERTFSRLSYINKNHKSHDGEKQAKAVSYHEVLFGSKQIDLANVKVRAKQLSNSIRTILEPVMIRRNRKDLEKDPEYSKEVKDLPKVQDPKEIFFKLTKEQSSFYDEIINDYFGGNGRFKGPIYRPFVYEIGLAEAEKVRKGEKENFEFYSQTNLYEFMKRLFVKRFESSFGSFEQSVRNFKSINEKVLVFIKKSKGRFLLDRNLMDKIYEMDLDAIETELTDYSTRLAEGDPSKYDRIYDVNRFVDQEKFIKHIQDDVEVFEELLGRLESLKLTKNDPKFAAFLAEIERLLRKNKEKKIVVFSEYVDTVAYLEGKLKKHFGDKYLTVKGNLTTTLLKEILENFDASYAKQENKYQLLISTDKISEGFNLNRAGVIVNYDIPWNPTRVIQRIGRINRIGKTVHPELDIFHFFPTEMGADIVRSRQIAQEKMFLIHNTLGEDSKVFEADETPTAARLYSKIMENPETQETLSFLTQMRLRYFEIAKKYPQVINRIAILSSRVKTGKKHPAYNLVVFIRKGLACFFRSTIEGAKPTEVSFEDTLKLIECAPEEKRQVLSPAFWDNYSAVKTLKAHSQGPVSENSLHRKALNNLRSLIQTCPPDIQPFMPLLMNLREDIIEYKTISDYGLRRIVGLKFNPQTAKDIAMLKEDLFKLTRDLGGSNYLDKVKASLANIKNEVIVAIENNP